MYADSITHSRPPRLCPLRTIGSVKTVLLYATSSPHPVSTDSLMISIIIPTHNEVSTIAAQLRAFREKLTEIPYEIIVSDDNSSDETVREATPYADTVVLNPVPGRLSISGARNRGARAAKYSYLVFTDGGVDIPHVNEFFKTLLRDFDERPTVIALAVNVRFFPAVESFVDKVILTIFDWWFILSNNIFKTGAANGKFQMVKKDAFFRINGYDETLVASEDFDLFHRLAKIGRTYSDASLTVYHSGRRAHNVGWSVLLPIWILNGIWVALFGRSFSKEWQAIR